MNALEKYASSSNRKKQRLKDALEASMKREQTKKTWFQKKTTRPLHPKTQLLESKLDHLEKGRKAGKHIARAKQLGRSGTPLSRGITALMLSYLPIGPQTVTGAGARASATMKQGKKSKQMAMLIRKFLTKGKA